MHAEKQLFLNLFCSPCSCQNAVAKVPSRRYRNTESRVPSTFLSMVTLNDIYDVHLRA